MSIVATVMDSTDLGIQMNGFIIIGEYLLGGTLQRYCSGDAGSKSILHGTLHSSRGNTQVILLML